MPRRAATENVVKLARPMLARLRLDPGQGERVWWDADLAGLGYRLRGTRGTWVIRPPRDGGKSSLITLGNADVLDITDARKAARERLAQAALGQDIRADRRPERKPPPLTVGAVLIRYSADAEPRMRASTFANLRTHVRIHFRSIHDRPLAAVTRADVAALIREISAASGPQSALRARRTLSTIYAWCIGEGLCEHNPVIGTNTPAEEIRRDRVLTDAELVAVLLSCPPVDDFGRIVHLLSLTGQRRDEIAGLSWAEIDLTAGVIRLPPARTKNKRPHEIPMSPQAAAILEQAPRIAGRGLVFGAGTGPFSGFSRAKGALDRRVATAEPWRLHDLRRTCATGMAEIGVAPHIVEAVINHVSGHRAGVAGIYNRARYVAETREAMNRWGAHVAALIGG